MRQRRELEKGWRKQKEQEAEERAREAEAVKGNEMKKWGCSVDAAAGNPKTATTTPSDVESPMAKKNGGFLDWLGWDGRQKDDHVHYKFDGCRSPMTMPSVRMTVPEKDKSDTLNPFSGNMSEALNWLLTNEYSPIFLRGHIPKDVDHDGPSFYHALYHPHWPDFRAASSPDRFEDELRFRVPWCDAFEDLVSLQYNGHMIDRDEPTRTSSAQWLNDMIKRGSLGPIMSHGLGGPQWSTEYARSVLPFSSGQKPQSTSSPAAPPSDPTDGDLDNKDGLEPHPVLKAFDIIREAARLDDVFDDFEDPENPISEISDNLIHALVKDLMKPGILEEFRQLGFTSEAQILKSLLGDRTDSVFNNGFLMAGPEVIAAAMRAVAASELEPNRAETTTEEALDELSLYERHKQPTALEDRSKAQLMTNREKQANFSPNDHPTSLEESDGHSSITSSSSSTSSWSRWGDEEGKKDSIVSTMTTTERRTLPDGTVETKRVLKKRFADGREESNESVERQMSSSSNSQSAGSKPLEMEVSSTARQDKQTQTNEKEDLRPKRSGWFWRE
jgi:hypothetical protein